MNIMECLAAGVSQVGHSGHEGDAARYFMEKIRPFVDEVSMDDMQCVIAHKKGTGPKIMLSAHADEIGMMVTRIEDDGCLRMDNVGGVDPRILPACRVWIHGREKLFGTVGAKPPHLLTQAEREKNYDRADLYVDVGYPVERVRELVQVGDLISFNCAPTQLLNDQVASKTLDDRACVIMFILAAERLMRMACDADVYFVFSSQEEVGCRGAGTAAFAIHPDLALVVDVCHATIPGSAPDTTHPIGVLSTTFGPVLNTRLVERLIDCAKAHRVKLEVDISTSHTGTDAETLSLAREGVPTVEIGLPLKYMHTTVETMDRKALEEGGRLIAHFLSELDRSWEENLWI